MIYLMRTKERMEKSAARHKIQSNMAKRVLLYGIRKEYSLKELPAIGKGIYGKPYFRNTRRFVLITVMRMPAFYAGSQKHRLAWT